MPFFLGVAVRQGQFCVVYAQTCAGLSLYRLIVVCNASWFHAVSSYAAQLHLSNLLSSPACTLQCDNGSPSAVDLLGISVPYFRHVIRLHSRQFHFTVLDIDLGS